MRILIIGLMVLAFSVAGISTYLIRSFSTPEAIQELEEKAEPVTDQILVATRDLKPGDKIDEGAYTWRAWPKESLDDQYTAVEKDNQKKGREKNLKGFIVRLPIRKGEPLLTSKMYKSDKAGFMAGVLDEGMRAVSVPVTGVTGVSGFILPGDRVDILVVHDKGKEALKRSARKGRKTENANAAAEPLVVLNTMTETVLNNVKVLAVNQALGQGEGQTIPAKALTLELTPKQAEIILTAKAMGQLSVVLRDISTNHEEQPEAAGGSYTTDVEMSPFIRRVSRGIEEETRKASEATRTAPVSKAAPASARKQEDTIQIFRGGTSKTEEITAK